MKHLPLPELNFLKSILSYCPDTGIFINKTTRTNAKKDDIAGFLQKNPKKPDCKYYCIKINYKEYKLHRLAYFYVTGIDPVNLVVDHKNGNTLDNRFENLRLGIRADNCKNYKKPMTNKSGFKGVSWCKQHKKWRTQISVNNKKINLGRYNSKFYAALVYARAAKKYFGEWRRLKFNF